MIIALMPVAENIQKSRMPVVIGTGCSMRRNNDQSKNPCSVKKNITASSALCIGCSNDCVQQLFENCQ